jgi:hypothetical protein
MPGVPKELIEHALKVDPKATPKKQRLRHFSPDKREPIKKELAKLLAAGFIKEVYHPEWLANPVLVQKKNNNEWRMCVDYTDLNKHCAKDPFGLPRIDQVIDSTTGCVMLSFLDCYSGCHQIALKKEDQIKTAFITPYGAYAYKTMSFGLKNAGSTYQRAIQLCFADGGSAGVLFISPKGEQLKYVFQILFNVFNNEAEYEALLHGLRLAVSLGIKRLLV